MLGAIAGDIIGSPYEFDDSAIKTTVFPLFDEDASFTDDTVMSLAVAEGLMAGYGDEEKSLREVTASMQKWGRLYPDAGYGMNFRKWLKEESPKPYGSYGNGSAMRVSSAGWLYGNLEDVEKFAGISAITTHDHPEGIKGAQSVAAAVFMARTGSTKDEIKKYIEKRFGYDLSITCDEIRPEYRHIETCQDTVPQAFAAFFEGGDFESAVRLAVSLGGDSDTLTAITGSIAEAFYSVPDGIREQVMKRLDDNLIELYEKFRNFADGK